jgi:hypothetical protein
MLKKSQAFRYFEERKRPSQPKRAKRPRRDVPVDTALPGVSATDRRVGTGSTARRNRSKAAARKASYALEDSKTGRPSRKSTRKSKNRQKPDSNLKRRQTRRVSAPKAAKRAR